MKSARSARAIDDGTRINSAVRMYFPLAPPFVRRIGRAMTKSRPLSRDLADPLVSLSFTEKIGVFAELSAHPYSDFLSLG
jgi:hypothetical protein